MADKSLLIGDDAADALVEYATLLARTRSGDNVTIRSIGIDGEEVGATFLLNSGTVLISEESNSSLPEPDNGEVIEYMRSKLLRYDSPDGASVLETDPSAEA